jgi:hypothetical protein
MIRRRNLLKAAPFVATLPSGAAWANASAAQCAMNDSQLNPLPAALRDPTTPWQPADNWVRVVGTAYDLGDQLIYGYNGQFYNAEGVEVYPPDPSIEGAPVDLLAYFGFDDGFTTPIPIGPYPLVQPNEGFQGLTQSCLTSFQK